MTHFSRFSVFAVALVSLAALGCEAKHSSTVSGKVTYGGAPLTHGTVTFSPQGEGRIAYGEIDASGNYTVRTLNDQGMVPGDYGVSIIAPGEAPASDIPPPLITPAKYADAKTSGLTAKVVPGANTFNFDLEKE
jgi:hypothetical protein